MKKHGIFGFALALFLIHSVNSCGAGIGGGGVITNPSLQMTFHPPTPWTYPDTDALTTLAYFPGQSLTQTEAQLRANGDINSAVLAGLQTLQLPTTGITITPSYTPPLVKDCAKIQGGATTTGGTFGYEEGGAITQMITVASTLQLTPQFCISRDYTGGVATNIPTRIPFIQQASVKIDGLTMSEYQLTLLAAKVSQYLMLNSKVDFTEEITVN
uniref:Uncharacterized protein n=1 Tax=Panagrolaimus davidi TaxID=227884 RepID=A0A914QA18_9BILA